MKRMNEYCILQVTRSQLQSASFFSEWLPFLLGARTSQEQTFEAILIEENLYFRSIRDVTCSEQVRVWFSDDVAKSIDIPEVNESSK